MHSIMIICPENSPLKESEGWLSRYGFQVNTSNSLEQANKYYELTEFHLLLVDQEIINDLQQDNTELSDTPQRIILDSRPSLNTGINSMANGATYYLPLPTDPETLLQHIVNALEPKEQATPQPLPINPIKEETATTNTTHNEIIGQCEPMQHLFTDIQKIAGIDVTVLIRGESGTGKELVAKAIHNASLRKNNQIVSINCAAIPENLIESELFGHEKGAFTGATAAHDGLIKTADKGTLFLDEIGELPLEAQARLLRVLQEGEVRRVGATEYKKVSIRLITATHRDLFEMVRNGTFREDLYYRLYVMELLLPPLRDRGDDISLLAKTLLEKNCIKYNRPLPTYSKVFDKAIRSHRWPGNVRELENAIERAVILSPMNHIDPANLKLSTQNNQTTNNLNTDQSNLPSAGTTLDDYLKHFVSTHQQKMTETQLAHSLGISRKSLWERRQKLNIPRKVTE